MAEGKRRRKPHRWTQKQAARAAKLGGKAVSEDRDHMAEIGRRGGQATLDRLGRDQFAAAGRASGEARRKKGKR